MADEPAPREPDDGGGGRVSRRGLLIGGGAVAVAGGATAIVLATTGGEEEEGGYPKKRVAKVGDLRPGKPVNFEYPLKGQQSVLLDMGDEVPGGVGDNNSIVAYSILCQHMGCPVAYRAAQRDFLCPCHQSQYDPAREGYVIQGVAQRPLPRIALEIDGDDVMAVGVDGLIYGYRDNLAGGQSAA
jgi:arsenite oxidase small subunit